MPMTAAVRSTAMPAAAAAPSRHRPHEDVQALFGAVAAHRLVSDADAGDGAAIARAILHAVPVD